MYSLKQKRNRKKVVVLAAVSIVLIALAVTGFVIRRTYLKNLSALSSEKKITIVTIPQGSSVAAVASQLEQKQIIRSASSFEWYVRSRNVRDKLQAGSYGFSPSQTVQEIVDVIISGKVATDLFTILPAQRIDQVQDAFVKEFTKSGYTSAQVQAVFDASLYASHPALTDKPKLASLEGYLYPESFQKTADTTPQTIIKASLDQMAIALTPEVRAGITRQGLTVHEGVILASIIEKEVSNAADRQKAAQVFLKRIKQGMVLGSDVTAYYGAEVAGLARSVLTDTPYNTRIYKGLPPGPISNVSKASLQAVADPAKTDYLYFVAGDDGITYFSNTLAEHEALAAQHCKKLCQE